MTIEDCPQCGGKGFKQDAIMTYGLPMPCSNCNSTGKVAVTPACPDPLSEALAALEVERLVVKELASDVYHQLRMRGYNHLDYDLENAEEPEIEQAARKKVAETLARKDADNDD